MKNNKGFTIIEVIIASGLMTLVALGTMSMMSQSYKAANSAAANQSLSVLVQQMQAALQKDLTTVLKGQYYQKEITIANPLSKSAIASSGQKIDGYITVTSITLNNAKVDGDYVTGTLTIKVRKNNSTYATRTVADIYCKLDCNKEIFEDCSK